eukprot:gene20100-20643_t
MDKIRIVGGNELRGTIPISGAKNAALPLMIASLLTDETLTLENVPRLRDVGLLQRILSNHGVDYSLNGKRPGEDHLAGQTIHFRSERIVDITAPYDLVSQMRASFWVIGPILARMGEAVISLPGGCAIGTRPVDFFIQGLEQLGAEIEIDRGYVVAKAPNGLIGTRVVFPRVSVGATHTIMMAATLAKGETIIENAAREPEIVDLCNLLVAMGAKISGIGTETLEIEGVDRLHGATYRVMPDRIEAGSYACAAAITGGSVELVGIKMDDMRATTQALIAAGVTLEERGDNLLVSASGGIKPLTLSTAPFPGFATDMQAQFMAMLCMADGASVLTETIFENRYMHVPELARMGADILVQGRTAVVRGVPKLVGAQVMATDLRASMSLIIAGLVAEGETQVSRVYHLERGYERLEEKLSAVGADIERVGDG